jgi:hypothetical protein
MMAQLQTNAAALPESEVWSVVVIYEDTAARDRAMTVCDHLMGQFWQEEEFDMSWWRFTYLADPQIAMEALSAAARADVIVFSVRAGGELSAEVKQWVEDWLNARQESEGALISLIDQSESDVRAPNSRHEYLREVARRGKLDFISSVSFAAPEALPDSLDSFAERAVCVTSVLDEILHHTATTPPPLP